MNAKISGNRSRKNLKPVTAAKLARMRALRSLWVRGESIENWSVAALAKRFGYTTTQVRRALDGVTTPGRAAPKRMSREVREAVEAELQAKVPPAVVADKYKIGKTTAFDIRREIQRDRNGR